MALDNAQIGGLLDTSILARYLLADLPEATARAKALIDSDIPLRISLTVLAELGFLVTRHYGIERGRVVQVLIDLLNRTNIEAHEVSTQIAIDALQMCAPSGRVSFADATLWAVARASGATVWTLDRRFPSQDIACREP